MIARTGSILKCVISGAYSAIGFSGGDLTGPIAGIVTPYSLKIRTFTPSSSFNAASLTYSYVATLQVQLLGDFGSAEDVLSIVQGAFYKVLGTYPASASITTITTPAGQSSTTGQPAPDQPPPGKGPLDYLGDLFGATADTVKWILIAIVGLIVLILLIVGYGPNVPKVARAVA